MPPASGGARRVFGIVPTYRRPAILAETLHALARQTRPVDELWVADNAPSPEVAAAVDSYRVGGCGAHYLPQPENRGPAGAIAAAMREILPRAADADWILLCDDDDPPLDDRVVADLLGQCEALLDEHPHLGAIGVRGARFDLRRGRLVRTEGGDDGLAPVDYLWSGFCPLYRVAAVRAAGDYPEELFFGFEELEYGLRLREAGYEILLYDRGRPRTGRPASVLGLAEPDWRRYYSLRNLIVILRRRHHTLAALEVSLVRGLLKPALYLPIRPRAAWRNLALNVRAVHDAWRGRLGRTITGEGELRAGKASGRPPRGVSR